MPDGVSIISSRASASAARSCATPGSPSSRTYKAKYPELADQLIAMQHRQLPEGWDKDLPTFPADAKGIGQARLLGQGAQRRRQERALADGRLGRPGPSTKTRLTFDGAGDFEAGSYGGRNLHFGIREHAMGASSTAWRCQGPAVRARAS